MQGNHCLFVKAFILSYPLSFVTTKSFAWEWASGGGTIICINQSVEENRRFSESHWCPFFCFFVAGLPSDGVSGQQDEDTFGVSFLPNNIDKTASQEGTLVSAETDSTQSQTTFVCKGPLLGLKMLVVRAAKPQLLQSNWENYVKGRLCFYNESHETHPQTFLFIIFFTMMMQNQRGSNWLQSSCFHVICLTKLSLGYINKIELNWILNDT